MADDVASLGLSVEYDSVERATDALEGLTDEAEKAGGATKKVGDESKKASGSVSGLGGALRLASIAAAAFGASMSVGALGRMADQWSDMQSRVGAAVKDMEAAPALMQRMVDVANASYSPLAQTVEIYGRNVAVLGALGRSATEAADFTEALNHALVTTATKGQDADVVLNALSRSIAIGGLRSMEFETIMSRSPRVLEAVAEQLGTNVLGLRAMAQEGKVTGQVIVDALINNLELLREEAGAMPATIGDAFTILGNYTLALVGQFDQAVGASEAISGAIITVAENLQRLATYAATAAAFFAGQWVVGFVAAGGAATALSAAVNFLRANIVRLAAATGIGLVIVAAGELIHQFVQLTERTGSWGKALEVLGRVASGVWAGIVTSAGAIPPGLNAVWNEVQAGFLRMIKLLLQIWNEFLAELEAPALTIDIGGETHEVVGGLDLSNWKANIGDMDSLIGGMTERAAGLRAESAALASEGFAQVGSALSELTAIAEEAGDAMDRVVNPSGAGGGAGGGAAGGGGATENLLNELQTRLDALREHFMSEEELLTQQFTRNQELLTAAREAELISMQEHNELKLNIEREYGAQLAQIQAQQYTGALNAAGDFFGALAGVMGGENETMLKMQRTFAAASALINAWLAASQVLADPTIPFWGKFAAVASVVTAGLNMVNAIKSGSSSASGRGGGGSSSSAPSAAPAQPQMTRQAVEINVQGDVFTKETVIGIMDQINELSKDNHMLVVTAR